MLRAYTGSRPQNAPIANPDSSAPAPAVGAASNNNPSCSFGVACGCGCACRVSNTGSVAAHTASAITVNSTKDCPPMRSNCCASASEHRFTTMYAANTVPRWLGDDCALSQLSMIAYSPTSTTPVSSRSTSHATGLLPSAYSSTTQAVHAAQNANARM